ncbi:MAG TPA: PQQ-binding-like beta-propeller repeat protein [Verrucomicrobiae bacterium]
MKALRTLTCAAALGLALTAHADWPDYRGPTGNGLAPDDVRAAHLPLRWSETENVRWKTPISHRGWSSPVVMDGRVWLTTATTKGTEFFAICVEAATGKVLHYRRLFQCENPEPLGNDVNSYASPSPVIEAGRVYLHFGSYGTACLDAETGEELWRRHGLPCRHFRGPGSSPVLVGDRLILTMDGVDVQYLVALDKRTGKTVWRTERSADWNDLDANGQPTDGGDLRKAFSTPLLVTVAGQAQLLSAGAKAAYGYDPATGQELWKIRHTGFSVALRPVFGHGLAFLSSGFGKTELFAIRADGRGDVTQSHVAWKTGRGVPRMPSPLLKDDLLFLLGDSGVMTCLEARTGKEVWQERLGGEHVASPVCAGDRIYCFSQDGRAAVVKADRSFEVLARNKLEDGLMASPAILDKALILRTKTHLYRIESAKTP